MAGFVFLCLIWIALGRLLFVTALSILSLRFRQEAPIADLSKVTIIIPARDEAAELSDVLTHALASLNRGASLIVVDDGSIDATSAITTRVLEGVSGAQLITLPENVGKAKALNQGLALVTTPYVLTIDADTRVDPEAVALGLVRLEQDGSADVVAFDISVLPARRLFVEIQGVEYDAALNFERRGQSVIRAVSVAPGAASLWRAEALSVIDGFDDATVTEDVDATLSLAKRGQTTVHVAGAVAWTDPPRNLRHLLAQRRRWCLGHYQNIWRHLPQKGNAAAFNWAVYPNFLFLSAFLPTLALTAMAMLIFGPGEYQGIIWSSTALWLPLVYGQRVLGLLVAGRRSNPLAVLAEPFTTTLLHATSAMMVLGYWFRTQVGRPVDVWKIRG